MSTYEETYKNKHHFSFGKNWQDFLKTLNDEKVEEAKQSLISFIGGEENIKGKSFVDIGCGSGLFSLAAFQLGADRIVSVDVDEFSIACVTYLYEKAGKPKNWEITSGSALDADFLSSLGEFDIVYSWGVLHHTGDMYRALGNVKSLVGRDGILYIALYNKFSLSFRGGTADFWLKVKRLYNNSGCLMKGVMNVIYTIYSIIALLVAFENPFSYIKNYQSNRGMSWYRDIIDWIGGYPYEFASADEIVDFFGQYGFYCKKLKTVQGTGCNEFLLVKVKNI